MFFEEYNEPLLALFLAEIVTFERSILNLERLILISNVGTCGSMLDPFMLVIPAGYDHPLITKRD